MREPQPARQLFSGLLRSSLALACLATTPSCTTLRIALSTDDRAALVEYLRNL